MARYPLTVRVYRNLRNKPINKARRKVLLTRLMRQFAGNSVALKRVIGVKPNYLSSVFSRGELHALKRKIKASNTLKLAREKGLTSHSAVSKERQISSRSHYNLLKKEPGLKLGLDTVIRESKNKKKKELTDRVIASLKKTLNLETTLNLLKLKPRKLRYLLEARKTTPAEVIREAKIDRAIATLSQTLDLQRTLDLLEITERWFRNALKERGTTPKEVLEKAAEARIEQAGKNLTM
ncbi:MAG: hypothetical protein ABIE23_03345 [archaeon]|nr:hypothetical protein [Candidatus Micrarchaeota archaeon]